MGEEESAPVAEMYPITEKGKGTSLLEGNNRAFDIKGSHYKDIILMGGTRSVVCGASRGPGRGSVGDR